MPRQDGTGPFGQGPMTGKGMGPCRGMARTGYGIGMGRGMGRGQGRGMRFRASMANLTKEDQKKVLEAELKEIDLERQEIEKRLKEME